MDIFKFLQPVAYYGHLSLFHAFTIINTATDNTFALSFHFFYLWASSLSPRSKSWETF